MKKRNKLLSLLFGPGGKDLGLLILRIVFGGMMLTHGAAKLANFAGGAENFADPLGLGSTLSFILIMATEVGASVFVMLGLLTRLAAIPLIFGMCVAAFVAHAPFTLSGSEMPLLYLGAFTVLLITGAGRYSADRLIVKTFFKQG